MGVNEIVVEEMRFCKPIQNKNQERNFVNAVWSVSGNMLSIRTTKFQITLCQRTRCFFFKISFQGISIWPVKVMHGHQTIRFMQPPLKLLTF